MKLVLILAVTSDALRLTSKLNEQAKTLERMQWWQAAEKDEPLLDKYLIFTPDAGGLNNIRMGWEMSGFFAQQTGRTLVLPPAASLYLLDNGPEHVYGEEMLSRRPKGYNHGSKTLIQDLINLKQLKGNLATLTWEEFAKKTGKTWIQAQKESKELGGVNFKPDKDDGCKSLLDGARTWKEEIMFLDGGKRMPFTCGEWWKLGGPRELLRADFQEKDWALLTHGFVWHPEAFDIASKVVNYLGLFQYNAIHARYGDIQFKEAKTDPSTIFTRWPTLKDGSKLYVATDAPEKFKTQPDVLMWDDLFSDKTGKLLAPEKERYSEERWFKLTGLVEELICTYSKLFVGSERSSFTGHIQRMRIHAGTPNGKLIAHHTQTESGNIETTPPMAFQKKAKMQGDNFLQAMIQLN